MLYVLLNKQADKTLSWASLTSI